MSMVEERYCLAKTRIAQLKEEASGVFADYIRTVSDLFALMSEIIERDTKKPPYRDWNRRFYEAVREGNYETSYADPAYTEKVFGEKMGECLCWYYVRFRRANSYAYAKEKEPLTILMELFIQVAAILMEEEEKERYLKETLYYFIHDYDEERLEGSIRRMLCVEESERITELIMNSDFSNTDYLYRYGEYVTEQEEKMSAYLAELPQEQLALMAETYTEGYRKGFETAGIDLTKKKTVQIRYHLGFEPIVRQAVIQFRQMGLEPVFNRDSGIFSTPPAKQYDYDHRYDDALYLNKALVQERLAQLEKIYEKYKTQAAEYAGPAVIETFGEKLFTPETKPEALSYRPEQEKLSVEYRRDQALIVNRFIPRDQYSFTIIAYPLPEIGEQFEDIFEATVRVNTLDMEQYQKIQQTLIDALDQGEYVRVTGRGKNHTELQIQLHRLTDPAKQTNFENCLADVNIPVGEVFTSPVLAGTSGVLHVTQVYLNELRYENLEMVFEDGMIRRYTCTNYKTEEENQKYVKENVLHNRDTLPMGEFAIGTNTTAYVMGRKFGIEAKLPILIAEKTGPHFAVGDTCYSMSEDVVLHNPDGKEIIAKENECSKLRHTDIERAYFNCHTDITIPYDELGDIVVYPPAGGEPVILIREGRFVLPGTEALNEVLAELE